MRKFPEIFYGQGKEIFETNDSFVPLFLNWTFLGIRFVELYRIRNLLRVTLFWTCLLTSPLFFFVGFAKMVNTPSMTELLTVLQASLNVIALPLKSIIIAYYMKRLISVEPMFKRLDERYHTPREREQIKESVKYTTRIFAIYFVAYFLYGTMTGLLGLTIHSQPLNNWLPFIDWIPMKNLRFWLHFCYEQFQVYLLLLNQLSNDSYLAMYMHALRTHINLLSERVSRLGTNSEFDDEQNFKELIDCIASHQELLQIVETVATIFSLTIFMQFTVAAAILCVCMLNIFIFADTFHQVVSVIYYICVSLQTFPTCYEASMLEAESVQLSLAIFHCNWVDLDKRSRKLLIYFIQRAQEEISFTAMKLFQINLRTNLSIAKFSFTLYAFMKEMGFGENLKDKK